MMRSLSRPLGWLAAFVLTIAILIACGSKGGFDDGSSGDPNGGDGGDPIFGNPGQKPIASLEIDPKTAALTIENGGPAATQPFKTIVHYVDGTTAEVAGATWTASNLQV